MKEIDEPEIFDKEASQTSDPLENDVKEIVEICQPKKDENTEESVISDVTTAEPETNLLNDVVDSIMDRWQHCEIIVGVTDTLQPKNKDRKLQPGESKVDRDKRLLRNRLLKFKNRLLLKIGKPAKAELSKAQVAAQSRRRRERRLAKETPQETAERKQREHISSITLRKRLQELETSEQKAERMAKDREKSRLRLHKKRATETPEERAARKQRQRDYQMKRRSQSLAIKTGKFYGRHKRKEDKEKQS